MKLSALGEFEECSTICKCHDCRLVDKVPCNPCLDCIGVPHDAKEVIESDGLCGYYRKNEVCDARERYLKKGAF